MVTSQYSFQFDFAKKIWASFEKKNTGFECIYSNYMSFIKCHLK